MATAERETTETARAFEGVVQWTVRSNRDRIYDALREAGPAGVRLAEMPAPLAASHLTSLRAEGHGIEYRDGAYVLTEDAWA